MNKSCKPAGSIHSLWGDKIENRGEQWRGAAARGKGCIIDCVRSRGGHAGACVHRHVCMGETNGRLARARQASRAQPCGIAWRASAAAARPGQAGQAIKQASKRASEGGLQICGRSSSGPGAAAATAGSCQVGACQRAVAASRGRLNREDEGDTWCRQAAREACSQAPARGCQHTRLAVLNWHGVRSR